uniref:ubiquitinyl hydrolase 1 n=1 Tax=viral metagenome TaxID=1070528 RepID=A0A6C0EQP9_9ZZZZ
MTSFVDDLDQQIKEIEKAFLEELYNLKLEDLQNLEIISESNGTQDIPDSILDIFKNTYGILNKKTDIKLNAILASMEREYKVNSTSNIIHDSAQLNQKQKASDPQKYEENYNNTNERSIAGINNPSNACFLNSTYQMLYSLPWFRNYINNINNEDNYNFIKNIFDKLNKAKSEKLKNIELKNEEHCPEDINRNIQNEPARLLDYIFNSDRVNENNKKDVFDVFFVNLELTTTCKEPNSSFITNKYEYSIDFVMSFLNKQYEDNPDVNSDGGYNTQDLIDYYGAYKTILQQQNLRSEICKEKTNQEEWNHLEYKLLIPQTNRYIIIKLGRITGETVDKTHVEIKPKININNIEYTLSGVIVHIGEDNAGHYIYINCNIKGNYQYIFDDEKPVISYTTENTSHWRYKVRMPKLISTKATMILYTRYPV